MAYVQAACLRGDRPKAIAVVCVRLLPAIPSPADPAWQQRLADHREVNRDFEFVFIGATVFRSEMAPTRSFVRLQPHGTEAAVSFWSSADFGLLSGFSSSLGSNGKTYSSMMAWSIQNYDAVADLINGARTKYAAPACPDFQPGPATFNVTSENSSDDALAIIQSLHDLYNNEFTRLKSAYEGREFARIDHETELKNNPPQAK